MATATSKRKRGSQDIANMRGPPGLHDDSHDFAQAYMSAGDDGLGHGDNNIDFSAMLQGTETGDGVDDQHQHAHHVEGNHSAHDHHVQAGHGEQNNSDTAAAVAAMAQYHHTMTGPQAAEQAFMREVSGPGVGDQSLDNNGNPNVDQSSAFPDYDHNASKNDSHDHNGALSPTSGNVRGTPGGSKPMVGSDEWHKLRKDNHKEVERRRRETINEGINELSKIVPGCEKNKGQILGRAVEFILELKGNETQNIEKWTLEKLLAEQAITELSTTCDRLKHENQRLRAETDTWRKAAQKAGITSVEVLEDDAKANTVPE